MQQQQLQRMQELAPLEEEDADQEPLLSQGLRDKIAGEPWLRAQLAGYLYAKMNELDADEGPRFPLYSAAAATAARTGQDTASGEAPPRRFARARSDPMAPPPLYRKKSVDQKQIRFHQCYFNPISCFKK